LALTGEEKEGKKEKGKKKRGKKKGKSIKDRNYLTDSGCRHHRF